MIKQFIIIAVLLLNLQLFAQHTTSSINSKGEEFINAEIDRYFSRLDYKGLTSVASVWFDVSYYKLNLVVTTNPQYLSGVATIKGVCREQVSAILVFDLMNSMHVDSVKVDGMLYPFVQEEASLNINLDFVFPIGQWLTIDIYYRGLPSSTGFGSFEFGSHTGVPWIWSLSEPYGARDWFPCKDHPSDKTDSADIFITCDSSFRVGSNGKLISVTDNGDGTKTHYWQGRYPIASYLISVAITNYEQFSNWFHYSLTDSMVVLNYVLPENLSSAKENLPRTIDMLEIFSDLFGLYPFIKEKYGHADFGRGGAMEHQTMTSTTTYNENTIAHELAHQWFGDMITCRTWSDLWLNEGFAQYATALYLERKYGRSAYWSYMRNQMSNARHAVGFLYVVDTLDIKNLFDVHRVYAKGASVLHMLRYVLGDSIFFKSLYNYANHPDLKYNTVSTQDFQVVCELTSGTDLSYFFEEWIYGEGYPHYSLKWDLASTGDQYMVDIFLTQLGEAVNPPFFSMPIEIKLVGDEWDTTVTVMNSSKIQAFSIRVKRWIKSVQIDPDGWILKDVFEDIYQLLSLHQNYPNPVGSRTTIVYQIPSRMQVEISIYNVLGQKIQTLTNKVQHAGVHEIVWDNADSFPIGIYFYQLKTSMQTKTKKLIINRR